MIAGRNLALVARRHDQEFAALALIRSLFAEVGDVPRPHVVEHAKQKLARKGCDWILANDVSPESGVMGGDSNTIHLVTASGVEDWPPKSKSDVAAMLIERISATIGAK